MVADHQSSKHQGRINARVNVRFVPKADIPTRIGGLMRLVLPKAKLGLSVHGSTS